jgi:stage III sporulation protein AC
MNIDLVFKIAGLGIIVSILHMVLKQANKEEYAQLLTLVGVIVAFMSVIKLIGELFDSVKGVFGLW